MTITWKREGNSECCRMLLHSLSPIPQVLRNLDLQGKQRAILLKQWKASEVCPNCFGTHKQKCNIIGPTGLHSCMGHSKVTMTQWPYAGQAKGLVGISQLEAWERHLKQTAAPSCISACSTAFTVDRHYARWGRLKKRNSGWHGETRGHLIVLAHKHTRDRT